MKNLTKMKSFKITCAEVSYFEIEVDAQNEDEARKLAHADINSFEVLDDYVSDWDIHSVEEIVEDVEDDTSSYDKIPERY